jgi:hypothetical protein
MKYTVAGSTYKVTGSPRFPTEMGSDTVPVKKTENLPCSEVQNILQDQFLIPIVETADLNLDLSNMEDAIDIWAHM